MKQKIVLIMVVFVAVVLGSANAYPENSRTVKVGVILPLTGKLAPMGEVERNAMILAMTKANSGSKRLDLIFEDGKGNPTEAATIANRLIDIEKVDLLITSTTGASLAVEPITTRAKKNLIAFCMDPDISRKSEYVVRFYEGLKEESEAILDYFDAAKGLTKVGVLYVNVPVFEKVVNEIYLPFLKRKRVSVPVVERYTLTDKDFRVPIFKMKQAGIDHLIILGYGFEYDNIFNQLAETGLLKGKLRVIGGWGFLYTPVDPLLLEGVLVSGPEYVFKEQSGDFQKEYLKRYGKHPNFDAAFAYNVIMELGELVKSGTDLGKPLKTTLVGKRELSGVTGKYYFSPDGDMVVKTSLGVYRKGSINKYE
jgi:branched-chain amino acid transport system substrate-binding protein